MTRSRILLPLLVAAGGTLGGCYVRAEPEPVYATTEITAAPIGIETYPHTVYEGRTVYLYNNRWYYRDRDRWVYYRNEPPPLYRQRQYVQQAPPAQRGYPAPGYGQPRYQQQYPQPYPQNAPGSAPPATRVQ